MKKLFGGRRFTEVEIGESFFDSLTITETHFILGCGLFKDFNPLHCDQEFNKRTIFGERILHGPMTAAIMTGVIGNYFSDCTIAFLEQQTQFKAPVKIGDTLTTEWEVVGKEEKERYRGGIVILRGFCRNQGGTVVAEGTGKILVSHHPL
jgi:3-hydroxybutyryl-CoA dehydratase